MIPLPTEKGLACLRGYNVHLSRFLWLSAAIAITVLALVAPLSAAILSHRAGAVHARSLISRSVQTSRLGIASEAFEDGAISSGLRLRSLADQDAAPTVDAPSGVPSHVARIGFSAFAAIAAASPKPVGQSLVAPAAPRGPPTV